MDIKSPLPLESVWDYPRPPRLEPVKARLRVVFADHVVADSMRGYRVLETSHPPTYYIPPEDIDQDVIEPATGSSLCEYKGRASYWTLRVGERSAPRAAWSYPDPTLRFRPIAGHLAFYPGRVDTCLVNDEVVVVQEGDFYGGWITSNIRGPFKGAPGTLGW